MEDKLFIVENSGNTCYINSLIMGLFFAESSISKLLTKDLKNTSSLYLQEYIKINYVDQVKDGKSVLKETVEFIRNLCFQLGWKNDKKENSDEYTNQQDVNEFYTFLMELFENTLIEIKRTTFTEALPDKSDSGTSEFIPFIPLSFPENTQLISIKDMLHNWLYNNLSQIERFVETEKGKKELTQVTGINSYNIVNNPTILPLSINRFNNKGERIELEINIQRKIIPTLNKNYLYNNEWGFHCAICHKGETIKSGHYYCLLSLKDQMFLFDDCLIPSLNEVSMEDKNITDMIKKECIFLIYKLI